MIYQNVCNIIRFTASCTIDFNLFKYYYLNNVFCVPCTK
uniref:Uncharacterized protein n=1 Tax=Anguilla anguilla TaxID=7936 RepID=A0A0E9WGR0_ANGAN